MSIRVAINGYGRIGRCILRAIFEYQRQHDFEVVVINDTAGIEASAHFTQYDSTHGRFPYSVEYSDQFLIIENQKIQVISERHIEALPWEALNIDLVLECTGCFTSREEAGLHLKAGAKKVLISAPAETQMPPSCMGSITEA